MGSEGVQLGCEVLCADAPAWFFLRRLGLLANQASVDRSFTPTSRLNYKHGGNLTCLFSPQHGFYAEKQANMQESGDNMDTIFAPSYLQSVWCRAGTLL